jgi:hypothetical protein
MASFTKCLCLSLLLMVMRADLLAEKDLHFKGDYFIYSDDLDYLYGGGHLVLDTGDFIISADTLYLDMNRFEGVVTGAVIIKIKDSREVRKGDLLVFRGFPFSFAFSRFGKYIDTRGDMTVTDAIKKISPSGLKKSDLYWEFSECRITKTKKIKAKKVFPFILGLPSFPFESFSIARGKIPEKTRLYFKNVGFSSLDGLSLTFLYRVRETFLNGDTLFKFYEREIFNGDSEIKRGITISGQLDWLVRKKSFLNMSGLYNTADDSFNLTLMHRKDLRNISYSFSQNISSRENVPAVYEFNSWIMFKKFEFMSPKLGFSHNLKSSYSYEISSPFKVSKTLNFNLSMLRKIIREDVQSDTRDFSASMDFTSSILNLSSAVHISENLLEATRSRNFTTNLRFRPLNFLEKNITITISPYYMFSTLPGQDNETSRITPGINAEVKSIGMLFPFGFSILPTLNVNHQWNNQDVDQTEFNTFLSLKKKIGRLELSLDYSLVSRYRSEGFWVEGYNVKSLNLSMNLKKESRYSLGLRLYYNNDLALENITFSGEIYFPANIKLSSFLLYYWNQDKFQSVEVFVEKKFSNIFKLQCGYSLALKKFFVKFFTL